MTDARSANPAPRLEAAFTRIWKTRMEGLPFLNANLRVEAVGFRSWEGQWLGALVTPWFVNLVLVPGEGEWNPLAQGGERVVVLPAGGFRFVSGHDEEIGEYHACSLFSPAQEFADHDTARAVAAASLAALFDPANDEKGRAAGAPPPSPVSKRDFLRGRFSGAPHVDRG
ncbi:MAG: [NiFe]-hydrogenase assembly chaperone HybE [Betaproteobacteria bacterium]|nr:[NiFe]-hydrogenase assembly chaperone HybE [Betaproteobacteria bacterium]